MKFCHTKREKGKGGKGEFNEKILKRTNESQFNKKPHLCVAVVLVLFSSKFSLSRENVRGTIELFPLFVAFESTSPTKERQFGVYKEWK